MNAIDLKLMVACRTGKTREVRRLIARGADVNAKHALLSLTSIEIAVRSRHLKVLKLLLRAGADKVQNERFTRVMREAVKNGFIEAYKLLAEYWIDRRYGIGAFQTS